MLKEADLEKDGYTREFTHERYIIVPTYGESIMEELDIKGIYYTPNVSEFYPGFEYIYNGFGITNRSWVECVYEPLEHIDRDGDFTLPTSIKDGEIKVKYLDKEDIESLGFVLTKKGDEYIYRLPNTSTSILWTGHNPNRWTIHTGLNKFSGNIKNISELKVLLKQLGTDE